MNKLDNKQFIKLCEGRGLKLKNDKLQTDRLMKAYLTNPHDIKQDLIKDACAEAAMIQKLQLLIQQLAGLGQKANDRFYQQKDYASLAASNMKKANQELQELNRQRQNTFEHYHKLITYIEKEESFEIILLITSPTDIIEVNVQTKNELIPLDFYPKKIQKNVYAFSYLNQQFLKLNPIEQLSIEIKTINFIANNTTIKIKDVRPYLANYYRAGMIVLEFCESAQLFEARTIGILYSVCAMSIKKNSQTQIHHRRFITYQWLTLFYSLCFSVDTVNFAKIVNFDINLESKINYQLSRFYIYLLRQLTKQMYEISQFLHLDNKLMNSLQYPLINKSNYNLNDNNAELQKIYIQFCLRYSLKVDKKITTKAGMLTLTMFNIGELQTVILLKEIIKNCPEIVSQFDQSQIIKLTSNRYVLINTAFCILSKVFEEKKKNKLSIDHQDQLLLKFLAKINQKECEDSKQSWDIGRPSRQDFNNILFKQEKFIIKDQKTFSIYYKYLKKLFNIDIQLSKEMYEITKVFISSIYKATLFNKQLLQCLTVDPCFEEDKILLEQITFQVEKDIKHYDYILQKRFIHPNKFQTSYFDQILIKFIQYQIDKGQSINTLIQLSKIFDQIVSKIPLFKKKTVDLSPFHYILSAIRIVNLNRLQDQLLQFISSVMRSKNRNLKDFLIELIKKVVIAKKIQFSEDRLKSSFRLQENQDNRTYYFEIAKQAIKKQPNQIQKKYQQYWKILIEDKNCGKKLKEEKLYNLHVSASLILIQTKLKDDDLYIEELEKIYGNCENLKAYQNFFQSKCSKFIQDCFQKFKQFKEKMRNIKQIFVKFGVFSFELNQINTFQENMKQNKLKNIYKLQLFSPQFKQLFDISIQVKQLGMTSPQFKGTKILKVENIVEQYHNVESITRKRLQQFLQPERYTYQSFRQLVKSQSIERWCKILLQDNHSEQILRKINILKKQKLNGYYQIVQAYTKTKKEIQKIQDNRYQPFVTIYKKISKGQEQIYVTKIWEELDKICEQLANDFKLKPREDIFTDDIVKIITLTGKHYLMFDNIEAANIDSELIMNLKETVMDQIYSSITIASIQEFESVVSYCNEKKKHNNFHDFITKLRKDIAEHKISLSQNIIRCSKTYEEIIQKSKQIQDKQTSFRNEIELIFNRENQRIFKRTPNLDQLEFQLHLTLDKNNQNQTVFNMKQLKDIKQRCLIFKAEVENKKEFQGLSIIFNIFLQFYDYIENIRIYCQTLLQYGYNPHQLQVKIIIEDNLKQLKEYTEQLEVKSRKWKQSITYYYRQSFLFTFFLGKDIIALVKSIVEKKMPKQIENVCNLQHAQFQKLFEIQKYQNICQNSSNEEQKLKKAVQFLKEIQEILVKKKKSDQNNRKKNRVTLNFTAQSNYIYQFDHQQIPKVYQIFFCLQQTKLLQLQIFLNRCFRSSNSIYYIIGAHFIKQELKSRLFELVQQTHHHADKNTGIELKFIDSNRSDILYHHLKWCTQMEVVEIKEAQISQNISDNQIIIKNFLENVELVTSKRPGLGKTYYVEKQQKDINNLIYFPISGNINFNNIAKRLRQYNMKDKCFLLQIGFIEKNKHKTQSMNNIEKLQILLNMILLLKAFYYNGEYIYLSDIHIFIQMQNQFQDNEVSKSQIIESKGDLLSLLRKFKKHHHITQFNSHCIQFRQDDIKQIFVLKYLEILEKRQIKQINIKLQDIQASMPSKLQVIEQFMQKNDYFIDKQLNQERIKSKFIENGQQNIIKHKNIDKIISLIAEDNTKIANQDKIKRIKQSLQLLKANATKQPLPKNSVQLIQKYFVNRCRRTPSYRSYHQFIKILFEKLKTFSKSYNLSVQQIQYYQRDYYLRKTNLGNLREDFFNVLLQNTIRIIEQTTITEIGESKSLDKMQRHAEGEFYRNLLSSPTIILSSKDQFGYQFINRRAGDVQFSIKSLVASQNIQFVGKVQDKSYNYRRIREDIADLFKNEAFDNLQGQKQEQKMMETFSNISGKPKFNKPISQIYESIKGFKDYRLTLDNFYKICYIIQKANSFSPIVLMGESGVGKTALIKFTVNEIFQQKLLIYNVHAGIHVEQLEKWVQEIINTAVGQGKNRVWVFFDQFNTSDELSYIKQIVIDRRFQGYILPQNIVFCTACNPYRMKLKSTNQIRAFNVKPPNPAMISFMWDYEQLRERQCESYCYKILKEITYKQKQIVKSIVKIHCHIHENYELSYASLRDVARFKELYFWFYDSIPKKALQINQDEYSAQNYKLTLQQRSVILAFCFVYSLKLPRIRQKQQLLQIVQNQFQFKHKFMLEVLKREQIDYVFRLKQPNMKIAYNKALRENLFTAFVCILTKIPVLLIGSPGSSKSLSVKLINQNLRGKFSKNQFCKQFPQFMFHYFQGSQSSTSQGILKPFLAAQKPKPEGTQYLIVFDELGIAQKSIHNPTKVLHSKLQTDSKTVSIIALSNTKLDCSKMSRFLIVQRQDPQKEQLIQTAKKIYKSFAPQDQGRQEIVQKFAQQYESFRNWYYGRVHNYYGQRDFYCSLRYICSSLVKPQQINRDNIIGEAIRINYDGFRQNNQISIWYKQFVKVAGITPISRYPPIKQVIKQNLSEKDSRYLLFIAKQDSIIQFIVQNKTQQIKQQKRVVKSIYCSPFNKDNQSQQYNIQFTSKIISQMAKGNILSIKDLNNSIQTSLYDLFNKLHISIGGKNYCRIVVGATSNPKCYVNQSFSVIIFMKQENYQNFQGAFLNRFEKHFISILDELTIEESQLLKQINNWIKNIQALWKEKKLSSRQNYLLNSNDYSLASLIIKNRGSFNKSQNLALLKQKILQNSTTDFDILINKLQIPIQQDIIQEIQELKRSIKKNLSGKQQIYNPLNFDKRDLIIFTYCSFDDFKRISKDQINSKIAYVKVSETEKALKEELVKEFKNNCNKIIQIYLNFERQNNIIDYILHFLQNLKKQNKFHQQIRIIIQLNRYLIYNNRHSTANKINISYLHDYEQLFCDPQAQKILTFSNEWQIFEQLFSEQLLQEIYIKSVLQLNISIPAKSHINSQQYIKFLFNLLKEQSFKDNINNIIKMILKQQQIKYNQIVLQKKHYSQKANQAIISNNMKELFINYLHTKVINIFQNLLHLFLNNSIILFLTPLIKKQEFYIQKDLQNLTFRKFYFAEKSQLEKESNSYWGIIQSEINKIKQISQISQPKLRIHLQNLMMFIYPKAFMHMKYLFRADKSYSFENLQTLASKLYSPEQKEDDEEEETFQQKIKIFTEDHLQYFQDIPAASAKQFLLLNDIIKFYLHLLGLDYEKSCLITELYLHFVNPQIVFIKKLTILLFKRHFSKIFFQIIILLGQFYSKDRIKEIAIKFIEVYSKQSNYFCQFINVFLRVVFKCISLQNYSKTNRQFSIFASLVYQKVIILYYQCPSFQGIIQLQKSGIVENRLVNLFSRLNSRQKAQSMLQQYLSFEKNEFGYLKTIKFCKKILQQYKDSESQNNIIRFLACDLYGEFSQDKTVEKGNCKHIIRQCFILSEKYPSFANLLTIKFFPSVYGQYFNEEQNKEESIITDDRILDIYQKIKDSSFQLQINNQISNLKVALGLYFKSAITSTITNGLQQNKNQAYSKNHEIMKQYSQSFAAIHEKMNKSANNFVSEIFSYQFFKVYYEQYIDIILFDKQRFKQEKSTFDLIGNYFSKPNQICRHLQIYLLKYVYRQFKDQKQLIQLIQKQKKSYPWLSSWSQFLNFKRQDNNYPLPLNLFDKNQQIFLSFFLLKQNRFSKQFAKPFIIEGLTTQRKTYQLLTIFTTFLCFDQLKEAFKISLQNIINQIEELKNKQNQIVKRLLICYLNQNLSSNIRLKKIAQYKKKLPLLNFLNLICAYRKENSCFIEMFFNKGKSLQNFQEWTSNKYLFGTINNPQLVRCLLLSQKQSKRYIYSECSQNCSFLKKLLKKQEKNNYIRVSAVQSTIMEQQQICPICQKRQFSANQAVNLHDFKQLLALKKQFKNNSQQEKFQLLGYCEGKNVQEIKSYNKKIESYYKNEIYGQNTGNIQKSKNILKMIQFFIWYVFQQINFTKFGYFQTSDALRNIYEHYLQNVIEKEKIPQKDYSPWLYRAAQILEQIIIDQSANGKINSLNNQTSKINFQIKFNKKVINSIYLEYEKAMKANKMDRYPTNQNILEESGNMVQHQNEYKLIRLFKLVNNIQIESLNLQGLEYLEHSYQPLFFICKRITEMQDKFNRLNQIYRFIYQIWLKFNFQLKRQEQNHSIKDILQNNISDQKQKKQWLAQLQTFFENFVYLVQKQNIFTHLKGSKVQFSNFILDNKNKQKGFILNFILLTTKIYNDFCCQLEEILRKHYKKDEKFTFFSKLKVNPTMLEKQQTFWKLSSQDVLQIINSNKYNSIVYGVQKYQLEYNQIQHQIVKGLRHTNKLTANKNQFKYFYFIDDDSQIEQILKNHLNEKLTQNEKDGIEKQYQNNKTKIQQFEKKVSESLQKMLCYLKYFTDNLQKTIGQFIRQQKQIHLDIKASVISSIFESANQVQVHPLKHLDEILLKDVFSKLRLKKLINLQQYFNSLSKKKVEQKPALTSKNVSKEKDKKGAKKGIKKY